MGLLSFLEGIPTHLGSVVKVTLRFHPMCPLPVKCHSKICAECGNAQGSFPFKKNFSTPPQAYNSKVVAEESLQRLKQKRLLPDIN
jgi:hypothetical protein